MPKVIDISDRDAGTDLPAGPALIYFHAEWCAPCRRMHAMLSELAARGFRTPIYSADVDQCSAIAANLAIRTLPALALHHSGRLVDVRNGIVSRIDLIRWVEGV